MSAFQVHGGMMKGRRRAHLLTIPSLKEVEHMTSVMFYYTKLSMASREAGICSLQLGSIMHNENLAVPL